MELHQQHREDIAMEETKIGMKLEEETKQIKKMCEKLIDTVNHELDKGIENIDTKELGEAIDMIKDLYEAKKEMYEACYYKQVMEAMEKHDFEDEEEVEKEGRKGYRGQPRDSKGRYMSRRGRKGYEMPMMMYDEEWEEIETMRDMDRPMGKMYYGGEVGGNTMVRRANNTSMNNSGTNRGYDENRMQKDAREGRSGEARRGYMETKEMNSGNSPEEKQHKMKELEKYMKELSADVTDMISDMSQEEKTLMKQKMQVLMQKI